MTDKQLGELKQDARMWRKHIAMERRSERSNEAGWWETIYRDSLSGVSGATCSEQAKKRADAALKARRAAFPKGKP